MDADETLACPSTVSASPESLIDIRRAFPGNKSRRYEKPKQRRKGPRREVRPISNGLWEQYLAEINYDADAQHLAAGIADMREGLERRYHGK